MKLFITDLDGTLLDSEKKVTEETRRALDIFTAEGNRFAICTGRALENALDVQKQLGLVFPGSFVVGYNGAEIYDCDRKELIYRADIPLDVTEEILALSKERGIHCQGYYKQYIVAREYNACMTFYRRYLDSPVIITNHIMDEIKEPPAKLLAIELADGEKIRAFQRELEERYGGILNIMFSNPWYLEMFPAQAGKGNAVKRLAEYLGLSVQDTAAAGDAENDISMLNAAGLGIAMANGSDAVKEAADIVTEKDNDHDGLAPFIRDSFRVTSRDM